MCVLLIMLYIYTAVLGRINHMSHVMIGRSLVLCYFYLSSLELEFSEVIDWEVGYISVHRLVIRSRAAFYAAHF